MNKSILPKNIIKKKFNNMNYSKMMFILMEYFHT